MHFFRETPGRQQFRKSVTVLAGRYGQESTSPRRSGTSNSDLVRLG